MAPPDFTPPGDTVSQVLIWTALPQGVDTDPDATTGTVRLSVLVSPQLYFAETIGFRSETSTELATYPDWVNWPDTAANISFQVVLTPTTGPTKTLTATVDPSRQLQPDYWAAMFGANTTRVDNFGFEDFSSASTTPTSFDVIKLHGAVSDLYNSYATDTAIVNASQSSNAPYTDPTQFTLNTNLTQFEIIPANAAAYKVLNPTAAKPITDAMAFHKPPLNNSVIPPNSLPILDFHNAISSLGHFPEMLRAFGLLIPLTITLPSAYFGGNGSTVDFSMAVYPTWTPNPQSPPTYNVSMTTACEMDHTVTPATFLSKARSSTIYSKGSLNLAASNTNGPFSFIDIDVDKAAHSVNNHAANLVSTQTLHAEAPDGTTLPYALPALHGSGPALIWTGWGDTSGGGLNELATNQKAINAQVTTWLNGTRAHFTSPAVTLHTEDITRGWRIDVADDTARGGTLDWRSLHWRTASYQFGAAGTPQIFVNDPTPIEGMVTPTVAHAPTDGDAVPPVIFVHEMITKWVGWSLSAPRPGGQISDDGTVSPTALGNPMPPTSFKDEYGNYNPQISATFTSPRANITVHDPVSNDVIGTTGLPALRYGHSYRFGARAVDLGGWSIPQGTGVESPSLIHSRWDPVKAPIVLPTATLTPGEGVHTVVLRKDGVNTPVSNARWLFPPKAHELQAEEHGALDLPDGTPDPSQYANLAKLSQDAITSMAGVTTATANGSSHVILPVTLPAPSDTTPTFPQGPLVNWIPDPAGVGYALTFLSPPGENFVSVAFDPPGTPPFTSFVIDIDGFPDPSPVFADQWLAEGGNWPDIRGRLLVFAPVEPSELEPRDFLPNGIAIPRLLSGPGGKISSSPDVVIVGLVPGSVYEVRLSSIFPASEATVNRPTFGLVPNVFDGLSTVVQSEFAGFGLASGQVSQITPYHSMRFIYAQLIPETMPAFSAQAQFIRSNADTLVHISDPAYVTDLATTSTVTYTASWTDPVDNPMDPTNDPTTATFAGLQSGLVIGVADVYADPVAQDPIVPIQPTPTTQPFGTLNLGHELVATHRIGDTKHHRITYTPTAAGRFLQFFAVIDQPITLHGLVPQSVYPNAIDPGSVKLKRADSGEVLIEGTDYAVLGTTGEIELLPIGKPPPPGQPFPFLSGVPLLVTYTPSDLLPGTPLTLDIPSTTSPPALKVTKVAPAWKLSQSGTPGQSNYSYKRRGNTLRVYLERPWYVTGANEMVGVLGAAAGAYKNGESFTRDAPDQIDIDTVTLMALDPINAPYSGAKFTQGQLSFTNTDTIPASGGAQTKNFALAAGNPAQVPFSLDPKAELYNIWGYTPEFDSVTNQWFADIELEMDSFTNHPPPGYFVRLALARFQPFSISGTPGPSDQGTPYPDACYLSPITLVTFAQPVVNRKITVVSNGDTSEVTVIGPAYIGWRPASGSKTAIYDDQNKYAQHPNSFGSTGRSTSTMVVEIQSASSVNNFDGDFAWQTDPGVFVLTADFTTPDVQWRYIQNGQVTGIPTPSSNELIRYRLRISELDYFEYHDEAPPTVINTRFRRSFVAHIPIPGSLP